MAAVIECKLKWKSEMKPRCRVEDEEDDLENGERYGARKELCCDFRCAGKVGERATAEGWLESQRGGNFHWSNRL